MLGAIPAAAHTGQGNATPSNIGSGHAWGNGDYCTLSPDAIAPVFDFHHACIHHDGCYAGFPAKPDGFGTYWVSRAQCDSWFLGDMQATCREMHTIRFDPLRTDCFDDATTYFLAVRAVGWKFYAKKGIIFPEPGMARPQIYPLLEKLPPSSFQPLPTLEPIAPGPPAVRSGPTYLETTGGVTNTWTNYSNAGGYQGPTIPSNTSVQIDCKLPGFRVADGNTWWYRIASSPWNGAYYASADAFYNNGQTSGSLHGTPFVDGAVRDCSTTTPPPPPPPPTPPPGAPPPTPPPSTYLETTGGVTNTWTNYSNAGGYQGPTIPSNTSVQIDCKLPGFRVADGNTWWYRIASSPWNGAYYASADAFYNNGQTSGSLHGTPFVDGAVRDC